MESHGYNTEQVWRDIEDVIIKTIISAHPIIKHNYHTCFPNHTLNSACFEILGFDILLDHKLKPWLLEVEGLGRGANTGRSYWGRRGSGSCLHPPLRSARSSQSSSRPSQFICPGLAARG